MRAFCHACAAPQPADWQAGDRCTSCGEAVLREQRCHWCGAWSPQGKFCRDCGSGTVSPEHFGAARMLKAGGVDQFSLPERLAALDGDQREHLGRLYGRQAAVIAQLVDQAAFAESFLPARGWALGLDDELTMSLPLGQDELDAITPPPLRDAPAASTERLQWLLDTSPMRIVRDLAAIALVYRNPNEDSVAQASGLLHSDDQALAQQAAIALAHWRPQHSGGPRVPAARELLEVLAAAEPTGHVLLARATLGDGVALPPAIVHSADPDIAFGAALATGDRDALTAALGVPDRRYAAALALARVGMAAPLAASLHALSEDQRWNVLAQLDRLDRALPELRTALFGIANQSSGHLRYTTAKLIARENYPGDALALVRLDPSDSSIAQLVLQNMDLTGAALHEVAVHLVAHGRFGDHQYGVSELATAGRLPDDFVPSVWAVADNDEKRIKLLRFAEQQLGARGDDDLHRFVISVVFGELSAEVRSQAWWVLRRWYASQRYGWTGPLVLDAAAIITWFGDVPAFLERVVAFLADAEASGDRTLQEKIAEMLQYTSTGELASLAGYREPFAAFLACVADALGAPSTPEHLRSALVRFHEHLAGLPEWQRWSLDQLDAWAGRDGDCAFDARETARRVRERSEQATTATY